MSIKNFFKKIITTIKGWFGISAIESNEVEIINNCPCETENSNCDENCECNRQYEVHHNENCKCDCHNKEIEEAKKELNPIVEDENQITIDDLIEEKKTVEEVPIKTYYSDDTITRDILIEELRKNGVTGISRLKRAELLAKFHEMNLKFPEVK